MTEAAARPASPPEIVITRAQLRSTFIPATREALTLAPMLRNSNPVVVRLSSHHTASAAASAIRKPALMRRWVPASSGRWALDVIGRVIEFRPPGASIREGEEGREGRKDRKD